MYLNYHFFQLRVGSALTGRFNKSFELGNTNKSIAIVVYQIKRGLKARSGFSTQ